MTPSTLASLALTALLHAHRHPDARIRYLLALVSAEATAALTLINLPGGWGDSEEGLPRQAGLSQDMDKSAFN